MSVMKDITRPIIENSNMKNVIDIFRSRCRASPFLSDANLEFSSIRGLKADNSYRFTVNGVVVFVPTLAPRLIVRYLADGEYQREKGRIYMTKLDVTNDPTGLIDKLIGVTGIAVGRSLHVNAQDDALIESLLG
ncbi:hypothetical protein Rvan_2468 [Rhodomicrobium vannielii ATCC 17100]|uniref:Uncharacterized protein n=1 Tax=Rhodomicrobium vannielii (strain ATCC 17100 / DSM 162 / LMG 4299 / NCIMB 10020 / ATH 3.1.1) TaxID=648757 RepID=E3I5G3_RHOVT|nr:hypothetical protein [Rhodomicrobium vannielii]ADP71684.1 hypothetical protein Rvan_2468 [Rhodomicrobium vannielii ATCC 17100]